MKKRRIKKKIMKNLLHDIIKTNEILVGGKEN